MQHEDKHLLLLLCVKPQVKWGLQPICLRQTGIRRPLTCRIRQTSCIYWGQIGERWGGKAWLFRGWSLNNRVWHFGEKTALCQRNGPFVTAVWINTNQEMFFGLYLNTCWSSGNPEFSFSVCFHILWGWIKPSSDNICKISSSNLRCSQNNFLFLQVAAHLTLPAVMFKK